MITTIITTYQRPQLLKRAIQSVLDQTYKDFRVCIYDNASGDETEQVVREFMRKDSRVNYFCHPTNVGMMENYRYAFSKIDTPFFTILSDDDYLLPWFYETALSDVKKFPDVAFVACGVLAVDNKKNIVADTLGAWAREGYFKEPDGLFQMISDSGMLPIPVSILFQSEKALKVIPHWNAEFFHRWDSDYLMQLAIRYAYSIIKRPCGVYLAHENSLSTSFYEKIKNRPKFFESHIQTTYHIMERLLMIPSLSKMNRCKIVFDFTRLVEKENDHIFKQLVDERKIYTAFIFSRILRSYFGINKVPFVFKRALLSPLRYMYRNFKRLRSKEVPESCSKDKYQEFKQWIID